VKKLAALHEETTAAFQQPKASRRAGIAKEFFDECSGLIETLDKLSARLTRLIKLEDAYVDQLMEIKQLGWAARNAGGDASVMISNALGGLPMPADPMLKFTANARRSISYGPRSSRSRPACRCRRASAPRWRRRSRSSSPPTSSRCAIA
jgi:hypothetical protein